MGMQEGMRANGWYNESADIGWNQIDTANEQYVEMIKQRITDFSGDIYYTIKFYTKKVISYVGRAITRVYMAKLKFKYG